ncbi:acyl carrier protein [Enterobacter sp. ENT03]|uniref:acyl carrier protein n=1 Tax=Enterobacter sp. ENT03 TaxID=2854780 RepID=UPI001C44DFB2|nr:acyl carrier protein [Enterobacter sp. ENT03]MBV7405628.1 acyl carrier protein [Enterobacter sp. ENT03]
MRSIEDISECLISAVVKIKSLPREDVGINSHILYDLYFDSVDLIEFLTEIEDCLNISINDDELGGFTTLDSISRVILARCNPA